MCGAGSICEISISPSQFCCKPKTALKNLDWQLLKGRHHVLGDRAAEKAMAPHSSTLAWKIPWTEEPGRLQSMGSLRVRHD